MTPMKRGAMKVSRKSECMYEVSGDGGGSSSAPIFNGCDGEGK